ncbi:MAG: hypothetical protein R3C14_08470 [Caldilineaceae bacterium]
MTQRISFLRFILLLFCLSQLLIPKLAFAVPLHQDDAALETPFTVVIGDEVKFVDPPQTLYIYFAAVMRDKRCAINAECAKAGDALFQLFVGPENRQGTEIFTIGTAPDQRLIHYQDYEIELLDVDPAAPEPGENFILIEYHLTLVVRLAPKEILPIVMDNCRNFTPYDAAAILQEPVNGEAPVGNVLFGPLLDDDLAEELSGLCGYTNLAPASDTARDKGQTYVATALDHSHVVVADHLTADILYATNGTMQTDWFDLIALAGVVSAANPNDDGSTFDYLYTAFNAGDYASLMDLLYAQASASPSFTVVKAPLAPDDPHDEVLWLWQTLDNGYFSLLISRQDRDFDVVAALLGPEAEEKTVRGYAQVILAKLGETSGENNNATACGSLTVDDVARIVGEPVQVQAVANEQGEGCKYTPITDQLTIDKADFTGRFQTHGLLAGIVPPLAAQRLLSGIVEELSNTGHVTDGDALDAILNAIQSDDLTQALTLINQLTWDSTRWQVEMLPQVSIDAAFLSGESGNGWPQFFLLYSRPEGGLYYLTGVLQSEIEQVRADISAAAHLLTVPTPEFLPPSITPPATITPTTGSIGCTLFSPAIITAILGEPVREQPVLSEQGDGCKYIPQSDTTEIAPGDFTPGFDTHGALVGIMPKPAAQWLLSELVDTLEGNVDDLTDLRAAITEGKIADALQMLNSADVQSSQLQLAPVPEVSDDMVWIHSEEEGYLLSFFLRGQTDGSMLIIAVQLPPEGDAEAMYAAVVEALTVQVN